MKCRSFCDLFAAREGSGALEFALVAVLFLMLIFGAMEFGRLIWTREALEMTAMQGARCLALRAPGCAGADLNSSKPFIQSVANGWLITLNPDLITPSITSTNCVGSAELTINYTFQTAVPVLLTMLSGISLTGHACFPIQS